MAGQLIGELSFLTVNKSESETNSRTERKKEEEHGDKVDRSQGPIIA